MTLGFPHESSDNTIYTKLHLHDVLLVDFTLRSVLEPVGRNVVVGPSTPCSGRPGVKDK